MIGEHCVQGMRVCIGVHRDRLDAHLAAGADDADGNLAAIRDQDFREHHIRKTPNFGGGIGAL
jgi:hypothetical protein